MVPLSASSQFAWDLRFFESGHFFKYFALVNGLLQFGIRAHSVILRYQ